MDNFELLVISLCVNVFLLILLHRARAKEDVLGRALAIAITVILEETSATKDTLANYINSRLWGEK